jgi:hypothetical protein
LLNISTLSSLWNKAQQDIMDKELEKALEGEEAFT